MRRGLAPLLIVLLAAASLQCTDASLEAAFKMMAKGGNRGRRGRGSRYMADFHVTFTVLTGQKVESRLMAWTDWWNENKHTFEVSPEVPGLPKAVQKRWSKFWEPEDPKAKQRKRGAKDGEREEGDENEDEDAEESGKDGNR